MVIHRILQVRRIANTPVSFVILPLNHLTLCFALYAVLLLQDYFGFTWDCDSYFSLLIKNKLGFRLSGPARVAFSTISS
jgi:hypothetical protein